MYIILQSFLYVDIFLYLIIKEIFLNINFQNYFTFILKVINEYLMKVTSDKIDKCLRS